MTGKELIEYIKREGLENRRLGIHGQAPITPDGWVGLAELKDLEPSDIHCLKGNSITVKQLYDFAKGLSAEDFEVVAHCGGTPLCSLKIDCTSYGRKIIVLEVEKC